MSDDGDDDTRFSLGAFPTPPLDECPVAFLGYYGERVVFALPEGEIRDQKTGDISRLIKTDIFNSRDGQNFLNYWREDGDKFARDRATTWFIRQCREAGYWDR